MIHRYWDDPDTIPDSSRWTAQVISNYHPNSELVEWTPDNLPDGVLTTLDQIAGQVDREDLPRHHANYVRWWAMYEMGGIWLDHDVIPLQDLRLAYDMPWTAAFKNIRTAAVLYFPRPHNGLAARMMHMVERPVSRVQSCVQASGDGLLNRICPSPVLHRNLPIGSNGQIDLDAHLWAMHLWTTSSERHFS